MTHDCLTNTPFVSSLKEGDFKTCDHHYDDLIRQVHATFKSHPSEWLDVRFALIALEEEVRILFEEIPNEESKFRRLVKKVLNIVKKAHDTIADHISNVTKHLPSEVMLDACMIRKGKQSSLSLTMKKTDLCEKIYGEYLMGLYNDGNATLADIVNHYSDMYGLTLSVEDVYDAFRRIKQRNGKNGIMYDPANNIPNRAYHTYEVMKRLNDHVQVTDNLKGGKPQRPKPYKSNEI